MAAIQSSHPAHWEYIGEGAANLIAAYTRETQSLVGKSLRLSKTTQQEQQQGISAIDLQTHILSHLIDPKYLLEYTQVDLEDSVEWIKELAAHIEPYRPDSKRTGGSQIDVHAKHAIIMDNLTYHPPHQEVISIEIKVNFQSNVSNFHRQKKTDMMMTIKPKWANLPTRLELLNPITREIKKEYCRTCVYRAIRSKSSSKEYYTSSKRFCALPLFDTSNHLRHALDRLISEWQGSSSSEAHVHNNLKIFHRGGVVDPSSVQIDPKLIDVMAQVLDQSNVLQTIKEIQSKLDPIDIEGLFKEFNQPPNTNKQEEDLFSSPIDLNELKDILPYLNGKEYHTLSNRSKAVMYALSMSFKDCSIFVTVPILTAETKTESDRILLSPASSDLSLHHQVKIIDLDIKPIHRLHKYLKTDHHMFSAFDTLLKSHNTTPTSCREIVSSL
ncbi:hypothetical protein Pst134EA_013613 [Puccinia striiformis f. sp. tritici]|uniref:hypothetical protein n=1 Tax=Puccinia striiformis f. sp. tritici TaxID=168172 RepID=UPI0020072374|nr:hypothetical protein Pst134EA_013613 [Puccinia striiformis f. sp. tritici]KAH9465744.1 hypothetical protein Pst134EA_013613 [Puccinia striiformis f. sp. tritici]